MEHTDIIIVGAGQAGLRSVGELARHISLGRVTWFEPPLALWAVNPMSLHNQPGS